MSASKQDEGRGKTTFREVCQERIRESYWARQEGLQCYRISDAKGTKTNRNVFFSRNQRHKMNNLGKRELLPSMSLAGKEQWHGQELHRPSMRAALSCPMPSLRCILTASFLNKYDAQSQYPLERLSSSPFTANPRRLCSPQLRPESKPFYLRSEFENRPKDQERESEQETAY